MSFLNLFTSKKNNPKQVISKQEKVLPKIVNKCNINEYDGFICNPDSDEWISVYEAESKGIFKKYGKDVLEGFTGYLLKKNNTDGKCTVDNYYHNQNSKICNPDTGKFITTNGAYAQNIFNLYGKKYLFDFTDNILSESIQSFDGINGQKMLDELLKGNFKLVDYFIENNPIKVGDFELSKALVKASKEGKLEIVKYLVEKGAQISAFHDEALRVATGMGHLEVVKYLVENGANINVKSPYVTDGHALPLWEAATYGYFELVKYFLENGAKIDDMIFQEISLYNSEGYSSEDYFEIIKYLLENGANIHRDDEVIVFEAEKGHLENIKYLLEKGANIHTVEKFKKKSKTWKPEVVKYLVENGADLPVD